MKRFVLAALAVLLAWLGWAADRAVAQNIYPFMQPRYGPGWQTPLSPYLNLLIPGNTAVNYYALVEPQFQRRQYQNITSQTLQGLLTQLPPPPGYVEPDINAPLASTGHPTAFNYTGSYFNSTLTGQSMVSGLQQRGATAGRGAMGAGRGAGMMGGGMMGGGMMGGSGIWPNMRPGIGPGR